MGKSLSKSVSFGSRSNEEAFALITSEAYQSAKLADTGAKDIKVTITAGADGSATVVLDRSNPVEGVPGAVKKIVGDWAHVIETQKWDAPAADGSRTGTHSTEFVGQPLTLSGTLKLAGGGSGTEMTVNADIKASIPLIGGKVEDTTVQQTTAAIEAETKFLSTYSG